MMPRPNYWRRWRRRLPTLIGGMERANLAKAVVARRVLNLNLPSAPPSDQPLVTATPFSESHISFKAPPTTLFTSPPVIPQKSPTFSRQL